MIPDIGHRRGNEPFLKYGEAYITISILSDLMIMNIANAEGISQITKGREQFPKQIASYAILRQFGDNLITTEGAAWRMHRKITSATFNEKNAGLVFKEAISQSQGMLRQWVGPDGRTKNETLPSVEHDTMRLALNIIGYAGFGMRLLWPGESLPKDTEPHLAKYASLDTAEGHTLSFVDTIAAMLDNILMLLIVPSWLLSKWLDARIHITRIATPPLIACVANTTRLDLLPFKITRLTEDSRRDYLKYMNELIDDKLVEIRKGNSSKEGMDLIGQLVRSAYKSDSLDSSARMQNEKSDKQGLTREEIIGNGFILLVAGHETTANAIHFSLLYLAANPSVQRKLQKEIDELLGGSDPSTWDFDTLVNPMLGGMIGACLNETLRLMPAVVTIPKVVSADQDQSLTMDGQRHFMPRNMDIGVHAAAVHRNSRYWPTNPSKIQPGKDDIDDFVPDRWFQTGEKKKHSKKAGGGTRGPGEEDAESSEDEDFGGFLGRDTSAQLYRPPRGSYIPFSDGARSCLGRRIAQVEIIAALAVIFRSYSVEFAVDEWATDEQVGRMDRGKKEELYRTAQEKFRETLKGAYTKLTLKLHDKSVPIRVVRKGDERFVDWLEA